MHTALSRATGTGDTSPGFISSLVTTGRTRTSSGTGSARSHPWAGSTGPAALESGSGATRTSPAPRARPPPEPRRRAGPSRCALVPASSAATTAATAMGEGIRIDRLVGGAPRSERRSPPTCRGGHWFGRIGDGVSIRGGRKCAREDRNCLSVAKSTIFRWGLAN
jgi:hypothetical protein